MSWSIGLDMTPPGVEGVEETPMPYLWYDSRDWNASVFTIPGPATAVGFNQILGVIPNKGLAGRGYDLPVRVRKVSSTQYTVYPFIRAQPGATGSDPQLIEFPTEGVLWNDVMGGLPYEAPMSGVFAVTRPRVDISTELEAIGFQFYFASNRYNPGYSGAYEAHIQGAAATPGSFVEVSVRTFLETAPFDAELATHSLRVNGAVASDLMTQQFMYIEYPDFFTADQGERYIDHYDTIAIDQRSDTYDDNDLADAEFLINHNDHSSEYHRFGWTSDHSYYTTPPVPGNAFPGISGAALFRDTLTPEQYLGFAARFGLTL